jgi:dATP pyrophosphohydrolase
MKVSSDMIVCLVIRQDRARPAEFLQLRRAPGEYLAGTWQSVRGKVEPGEAAWQSALRELREETGLTPREFYKLTLLDSFYLARDDTIHHCPAFCAVVDAAATIKLNAEHDAFRWVACDEMDSLTMWATERQLVAEVVRDILGDGPAKPYLRLDLPAGS